MIRILFTFGLSLLLASGTRASGDTKKEAPKSNKTGSTDAKTSDVTKAAAGKKTPENPKSVHIVWLENPPFAGEKLPNNGIYPDIVSSVLRDAGYKVRVSILPWQRAVDGVKNLDFDINVGVWEHPMFEKDFDYLRNISIDPLSFVVKKDRKFSDPTFKGFAGKRVAFVKGGGYPEEFFKDDKIIKVPIIHHEQAIKMLDSDRVDAYLSEPKSAKILIDEVLPKKAATFEIMTPPIRLSYLSPAISKNHPYKDEIKKDFAISFEKLKNAGLYDTMFKRHKIRVEARSD